MYVSLVDYATVNFDLTILYTDVVKENLKKLDSFIGQQLNSKVRVQKKSFFRQNNTAPRKVLLLKSSQTSRRQGRTRKLGTRLIQKCAEPFKGPRTIPRCKDPHLLHTKTITACYHGHEPVYNFI